MAIENNWSKSPIIERTDVADSHVELILKSPELAKATPGQFAHVLTPGMLRRPISFSRIDRSQGEVGILFQIVGSGTQWLAQRQVGESLDVLGPLGHGFPAPDPSRPWILVGGGVGIPPLYSAAETWISTTPNPPFVIIGARKSAWILMEEDFKGLGLAVEVTTDDGSAGHQGTVIGPLEQWLSRHENAQVYACGPTPMLKAVANLVQGQVTAYLALEQRMGCGIGACLACVVPARGEKGLSYRRVCTEGPVFRAEELMW
ncbi:dihydroorotate dehydrogenase electron transfer subunit [Sulfobacillus thermosulfidooxidans]|uniref:dihydroorotate dehydrogenase electron transfer subunit n=1 Tax=Sulfobacillus thermosulfidooxidans TaxID=28034 RepID=UPI00041E2483|nr:dihydroorotate dehydrogenase electron transfer subunit [Sulfobacillus thermosulfidooxidans]